MINRKNSCLVKEARGFTLVEVLFSMAILLVVTAGVLPLYVQSSKYLMQADAKLNISDSNRSINNKIIGVAREADAFILYDSFHKIWIDNNLVDFRNSSYEGKGRLRDGETGKFLLLLYYGEDEKPYDDVPPPIARMVGIYMDAEDSEVDGPLKIFEQTNFNTDLTLEENIPAYSTHVDHRVLLDDMTGLLEGDIFYNFSGKSIIINGKIKHSVGAVAETNTYNFTITPR